MTQKTGERSISVGVDKRGLSGIESTYDKLLRGNTGLMHLVVDKDRVTYEIEPMGLVCKLTVTHDEFPRGGRTFETVKEGWPEILSSLKSLLETGEALLIPRDP